LRIYPYVRVPISWCRILIDLLHNLNRLYLFYLRNFASHISYSDQFYFYFVIIFILILYCTTFVCFFRYFITIKSKSWWYWFILLYFLEFYFIFYLFLFSLCPLLLFFASLFARDFIIGIVLDIRKINPLYFNWYIRVWTPWPWLLNLFFISNAFWLWFHRAFRFRILHIRQKLSNKLIHLLLMSHRRHIVSPSTTLHHRLILLQVVQILTLLIRLSNPSLANSPDRSLFAYQITLFLLDPSLLLQEKMRPHEMLCERIAVLLTIRPVLAGASLLHKERLHVDEWTHKLLSNLLFSQGRSDNALLSWIVGMGFAFGMGRLLTARPVFIKWSPVMHIIIC
jgi:hypothetical protein